MDTRERVTKIIYKGREILKIDYADLKEADMIDVISVAKDVIKRDNKRVLVLSIFNNKNFASPKFVRHVEKEIKEVEPLIEKNSITGITEIQRWIVKGINLWYKNKLHPFDSVDKALDFLVP